MTQAERSKERREHYKAHGICYQCGREKAAKGRTLCLNCLDLNSVYYYRHRQGMSEEKKAEYRKKAAKSKKRLYDERKAAGICVDCGKKKAEGNRIRCGICLHKQCKRQENIRRQNDIIIPRVLFGDGEHCACCGKPVRADGEKTCQRCYDKITQAGVKGRAVAHENNKGHIWRKDFTNMLR